MNIYDITFNNYRTYTTNNNILILYNYNTIILILYHNERKQYISTKYFI